MKIAVAGTGYVGLVTAVCLAELGHDIICLDIDENKIEMLKKGQCPIYENGLEDLMQKNKKKIDYTTDYKYAYTNSDIIIVGVGTPERYDGSANLDYVYEACEQIKETAQNDKVIIIKSTVPIGTNDLLDEKLNKNSKVNFFVASNPEFLSQGTAINDTLHPSRIVVGTNDEYSRKMIKKMYEPLTKEPYNAPYIEMDRKSAEMVKYASNNFLALKISYINEIANFCETIGADITSVTKGMSYDDRIGSKFLKAGIGYGGSCFPKDTKALHWLSKNIDCELKTIDACISVNKLQKIRLIEKAKKKYNDDFHDKKVAILGLSFKPGTDDLRETPAIDNVKILLEYGANVKVYDPIATMNFKKIFKDKVTYCKSIDDTIKDCDIVFIMTDLKEIINYNLSNYVKLMKDANIYDGRNCYDIEEVKKYNLNYYSIGRMDIERK